MAFNFIDHITEFIPGEKSVAELKLTQTYAPYFYPHSQKLFQMLLLEAIGQLNAWLAMELNDFQVRPVAILYGDIVFHGAAKLMDELLVETELTRVDKTSSLFNGRVRCGDKLLLKVNDAGGSFLTMGAFADPDSYRAKFSMLRSNTYTPLSLANESNIKLGYDQLSYDGMSHSMTGDKYIEPDQVFFNDHFPKKPVYPVSLLLENNIQLMSHYLNKEYNLEKAKLSRLFKIKMRDFLLPNTKLSATITTREERKDKIILQFVNTVAGKNICNGFAEYSIL